MALEKDLEEKCRQYALKQGCKLVPLRSPGNKGIHDRLLFMPGLVILCEFKRDKNAKVQPLQDWWQTYFHSMGIPAYRVWSLKDFKEIIKFHQQFGGMR